MQRVVQRRRISMKQLCAGLREATLRRQPKRWHPADQALHRLLTGLERSGKYVVRISESCDADTILEEVARVMHHPAIRDDHEDEPGFEVLDRRIRKAASRLRERFITR